MTLNRIHMATLLLMAMVSACGPSATPIITAVEHDDYDAVERLIDENPAIIDAKGNTDMTAMHWAAAKGRLAILRLLIERGGNVNAVSRIRETPLDTARRKRQGASETILRQHGGKPYSALP